MLTLLLESEKRSEQDKRQELIETQAQMADLEKQHDSTAAFCERNGADLESLASS